MPRLGDEVFVGAGARILGGLRIGDRAFIGANAVVAVDVPDDSKALVVRDGLEITPR
jgi:serine O-acetyltransferase